MDPNKQKKVASQRCELIDDKGVYFCNDSVRKTWLLAVMCFNFNLDHSKLILNSNSLCVKFNLK